MRIKELIAAGIIAASALVGYSSETEAKPKAKALEGISKLVDETNRQVKQIEVKKRVEMDLEQLKGAVIGGK